MEFISHSRTLVAGDARGEALSAMVGLSFWGGVDLQTGVVIDQHAGRCSPACQSAPWPWLLRSWLGQGDGDAGLVAGQDFLSIPVAAISD